MNFVYSDGGRSKYFTANNVGDCATRAIANATGCDYKLVYKALSKIAGESVRNGCPKNADKKLMTALGWTWTATMGIGSGCHTHLCEKELPSGTLIVAVSGHLTCVMDGTIYDTYNCSRGETRCVYGYWEDMHQGSVAKYEKILQGILKPSKATKKKGTGKKTIKAKKRSKKALTLEMRVKQLEKEVAKLKEMLKK